MKTPLTLLFLLTVVAGACSTTDGRLGTPIACDTTEPARLILFAQAVPTSDFVPCVRDLPAGWEVQSIETRTGEAIIVFDNDTHDVRAVGTLTETCATAGEAEPTHNPSIVAYHASADRLVFTFSGGCFVLEYPGVVTNAEADGLATAVDYLSRDDLRDLTGWTL
ncbi:MAG: hypothetical protein U9N84_09010 [Actinomycetota bacterium]|nr:hypothetical protein [Actinomycetota bacterium]